MNKVIIFISLLSFLFAGCSNPTENGVEQNETTYKLDSVCSSHFGLMNSYRYDQSGNLIYRGLSDGSWYVETDYDGNNRVKRSHRHHDINVIEDYTYDIWGYLLCEYDYDITQTDTTLLSKIEYTYDSLHCITRIVSMYYSRNHEWSYDYEQKIDRDYGPNKKIKCVTTYRRSNGTWILSDKYLYSYNNMDSLASRIYIDYENEKSIQKVEYTYDAEGRTTVEEWKNWDKSKRFDADMADGNYWKNSLKTEYDYDDRGNLILTRDLHWKEDSWECISCFEKEYNEDNEMVSTFWERSPQSLSRYEYDRNLNSSQIIMPNSYFDGEHSPKSILSSSHPVRHIYSQGDTTTFYYSPLDK